MSSIYTSFIKASTLLLASFISLQSYSQESKKLEGTPMGSMNVDYNTSLPSTTVNTAAMVFDGNFDTYYASMDRSNTWVGLDLGKEFIINKIGYAPRNGYSSRLPLGVFEGANNPDFGDALPLLIIKETNIPEREITYQEINCNKPFRYVRYIGPNNVRCNIAEVEFWGYEGNPSEIRYYQTTNIPTITIHTENNRDVVSKDQYLKGIVSFISNDGKEIYTDSLQIKGRGNASWGFPKKPYKLKLNNKASVLGNKAVAKDWTLINNWGDKTLMRNIIAFKVSERLGLEYTSAIQPVDVFLNGEYKGCYQLCDQIEVNENRVNVDKMKKTTTTLPDLSGGYLIEIDAYASQETSKFTSQIMQIPVTIKYPKDDEINFSQSKYIADYFNTFESALFSSNYLDEATGFQKYFDLNSFVKHFITGELSANTDTYWSTYMYKRKNDDKIYTGPVWDFDLAFDNDNRTHPVNDLVDAAGKPDYVFNNPVSSQAGNMRNMVNRIVMNSVAKNNIKLQWNTARQHGGLDDQSMADLVDYYSNMMYESQTLNFRRWDILNTNVHLNYVSRGTYDNEVAYLKEFIDARLAWMDAKIGVITIGVDKNEEDSSNVFAYNGKIYFEGFELNEPFVIYDMMGKEIIKGNINDTSFNIDFSRTGIYIINIASKKYKIAL
ncbi:MAG: CotH kinase family protein [Bacteroidales bacterium]|nr:CotH kinase family protein [Bacteroidales bacterium]